MTEPEWLDVEIVLDIHAEQLALFGGAEGLRDRGLLESALARPLNKFAYGESDLAALAAAYGYGLARNHPFVDGNKRMAFAAIVVFLGLNDRDLRADPAEAAAAILALAAGEVGEEGLARWIGDRLAPPRSLAAPNTLAPPRTPVAGGG
ncbi:type II toxin-antitoxin system death-on-curing family toxin [Blastochloris sulfoviridis]|uniref:Type II toxin-antitoxin system death-on-curing family toxin n=1 Tax=Blastochloris sulfoviridis TaxID=50712 RepID=A0A5M6HZ48_9HYPH|nr:type II toxin-antitoxin system death-on-curing family toxin [Blastochloris sulfoviridis]